jgi:hypothetical protein
MKARLTFNRSETKASRHWRLSRLDIVLKKKVANLVEVGSHLSHSISSYGLVYSRAQNGLSSNSFAYLRSSSSLPFVGDFIHEFAPWSHFMISQAACNAVCPLSEVSAMYDLSISGLITVPTCSS